MMMIRLNDLKNEYIKCIKGFFSFVWFVFRGLYVIMDIYYEFLYFSWFIGFYVEMY